MQGGARAHARGCHGAMLVLYSGCLGTIGVTRGMAGGLGTCQDAVCSDLEATRCGDSGGYPVGCPIETLQPPPKTCAWGIASQHGLLVLLQSFRFPQFVARGLRSCLSSRDREMATCES